MRPTNGRRHRWQRRKGHPRKAEARPRRQVGFDIGVTCGIASATKKQIPSVKSCWWDLVVGFLWFLPAQMALFEKHRCFTVKIQASSGKTHDDVWEDQSNPDEMRDLFLLVGND